MITRGAPFFEDAFTDNAQQKPFLIKTFREKLTFFLGRIEELNIKSNASSDRNRHSREAFERKLNCE